MADLFAFSPPPFDMNASRANLAQQVASGGINQGQMDGELARLQGMYGNQQPGGMPNVNISNPQAALQSQAQLNQWTAQQNANINRVNESNPFGSSQYTTNPDGSISRNTTLSQPNQQLVDQQQNRDISLGQQFQNSMGQLPQNPFNLNSLPGIRGQGDLAAERQRLEGGLNSEYERRNAPEFERMRESELQRLADQGIGRGNELYDSELKRIERQIQDARLSSQSANSQFAGQELAQNFGMDMQGRQNAMGEQLTARGLPFQEMQGLLGMQQGATMPQFSGMTPVQMQGLDAQGLYTNERSLDQAMQIAQMNNSTSRANASAGRTDPFALATLQNQLAMQRDQQQFMNQQQLQNGNQPSTFEQLAPSIIGGAATIGGAYLGS